LRDKKIVEELDIELEIMVKYNTAEASNRVELNLLKEVIMSHIYKEEQLN